MMLDGTFLPRGVMGGFGKLFLCVQCGVFGENGMLVVFEGQELSMLKLKYLFVKTLYEWSSTTPKS
jgi:hypothetical protein